MATNTLIDDIAFRINDPKMLAGTYAPYILKALNRVYQRINTRNKCLVKTLEMDFSTLDPLVQYWTLPADCIEVFRIEPCRDFRDPNQFVMSDEAGTESEGTYTIIEGKIYFSQIAEDDLYTIWYYSSGLELVDKAIDDLVAGEINEPEWAYDALHQLLYYATCLEISADYALRPQDERTMLQLMSLLRRVNYHKSTTTPTIMGGWGRKTDRDDGYGAY